MKKTRRPHTDLPQHIVEAIRLAWPDGVIDMPVDSDDAPFWEVYPRLRAALSHIPRGAVFYEREPRWLRASEEVAVGLTAEPLTVRDAFFFRGV